MTQSRIPLVIAFAVLLFIAGAVLLFVAGNYTLSGGGIGYAIGRALVPWAIAMVILWQATKKPGWKLNAFLVPLFVFSAMTGYFAFQDAAAVTPHAEAQFDSLRDDPEVGPYWTAMQRDFPDTYREIRAQIIADGKAGRSMSEGLAHRAQIESRLMVELAPSIAKAPDSALVAVNAGQLQIALALQREDIGACVEFGSTGLRTPHRFSPSTNRAVSQAAADTLEAARQGMDHPTARTVQLTEVEQRAFVEAVAQAAGNPRLRDMVLTGHHDGASASERCSATVAIYTAVASLSPSLNAKITARLMGPQ